MLTRKQLAQLRRSKGNRVREAMRLAELTQVDVATRLGKTQPTISRIVGGESTSIATAQALAELFGCQIEDLFPAREAVAS